MSLSGGPVLTATPLVLKLTKIGLVEVKLGGELIIGPGAGTKDAGVIAGVDGEWDPLDAGFGACFPPADSRYNVCLRAEAKQTLGRSVIAKAWLKGWDISKKVTLDALQGSKDYGDSPWFLPIGCKDLTAGTPGDSVLGGGVTKVDDSTVGSPTRGAMSTGSSPVRARGC